MHVIGAANLDVKSFPGNDRFRTADAIGFYFLNPALDDRRVRRAITLGIDRAKLAAVVGHGLDKTDRVLLPTFGWAEDPAAEPPVFDPLSANRLLDEAGWRLEPWDTPQRRSEATLYDGLYGGRKWSAVGNDSRRSSIDAHRHRSKADLDRFIIR